MSEVSQATAEELVTTPMIAVSVDGPGRGGRSRALPIAAHAGSWKHGDRD